MHRILIVLTMVVLAGCMAPDRISYGSKAASTATVEGFKDIRIYADANGALPEARAWLPDTKAREINYLALSGGGSGGAFSVGALQAWSDKGDRPDFDMVSGVSTGALIAPYAFLGHAYDDALVELYTSGIARDLVDLKFLPRGLLGASLLKQEPLRLLVERYLTSEILAQIAAEHRKGRRLLVLTTNLDSQRAVIWNMGAIAASGSPQALKLFQDVIIASASIPGLYPAVLVKARADGRLFEEMHSDGGSSTQVLTIPEGWIADAENDTWPVGRKVNLYILVNNALMPEFSTTPNNTVIVMARASSTLIKAQARSALLATYAYSKKTGIRFHMASIDTQIAYSLTDPFNTNYMRAVYNLGYAKMAAGSLWKDKPTFADALAAAKTAP